MVFHLFAGKMYYPQGGAEDYVGTFLTVDAAQAYFNKTDFSRPNRDKPDWGHITDLSLKILWEYPRKDDPWEGWGPYISDDT